MLKKQISTHFGVLIIVLFSAVVFGITCYFCQKMSEDIMAIRNEIGDYGNTLIFVESKEEVE